MPFLVNFSPWKSLAWASAAVFSPPGQHAKPPSQRLPRCHDESCGMFHRGTHWRTASPSSMPSENACISNAEMPGESNRNIPSIPRNIQLSKLNKKGWMLFWSLKQRDVSYEAIRMDNGHSLPCAQSGQTGQAKEKRFKRQRKKYVLSYANVCYCMFKNFWVPTCIWLTWHLQSFFFTFCRYPPTSSETKSVWETLKRLPANRVLRGYSWGSRVYRFLGQRLRSVSA